MAQVEQYFEESPDRVWAALPAGVQAVKGRNPQAGPTPWTLSFDTGMTLRSWDQQVLITLQPPPADAPGCMLTLSTSLKFGLFDQGEGGRMTQRFLQTVTQAVGGGSAPQPSP